ncbi:MAG TPA: DUF5362 family protein [bacterium]|nr:DUF5362 family protein [bacterium]
MEASAVLSTPDAQARKNAKGMAGWAKFMGIMTIIGGCMQALTIFGIVIAWLPIWMGVVLLQAGSKAGEYADKGDFAALDGMTGQLKTYFTISGVMIIASFALVLIAVVVSLVLVGLGVFSMPSLLEAIRHYR